MIVSVPPNTRLKLPALVVIEYGRNVARGVVTFRL